MSPAMAAAAAMTGRMTDLRKFLRANEATTTGGFDRVKITSAFDYLTDPIGPPPAPQPPVFDENAAANPVVATAVNQFTILKGIAVPLSIPNVDTDMIIPKQFLKTLQRTGLGSALFFTLRKDPYTGADTDFILNRAPYNQASILVCTGPNFGCGSSREHAPWSLLVHFLLAFGMVAHPAYRKDFGIRAMIAPSFGEIFKANSMQNGMLPIVLPQEECEKLAEDAKAGLELEVDLEKEEVRRFNGQPPIKFTTEPFRRHCLLNGLDDISLTLLRETDIEAFEARRSETWPWLDGLGYASGGKLEAKAVKERKRMDW